MQTYCNFGTCMDDTPGISMKFWLACFVLLFVSAELWQWVAQVSSGLLLVLGGLGLAAASNAAHLPKLEGYGEMDEEASQSPSQTTRQEVTTPSEPPSVAEQSAEDSISFKVRFPWQ